MSAAEWNTSIRALAAAAAAGVASMAVAGPGQRLTYPQTPTQEVVEELHGEKVVDPYRWLEDDVRVNSDVAKWVEEQNKVTFTYLESIPYREAIGKRLTRLWDYERFGSPAKIGNRYVFSKNDGLQNQSVLYVADSLQSEPRVLIDPNKLSEDGTVALAGTSFSDDGKYMAYGLATAGSDWSTWHVRDVDTGQDLGDKLEWIKFSGAAWTPDGKGFFYSRYPEPEEGAAFQSLNKDQKVYYHRLGTPQASDVLVYERPDQPDWGFSPSVTEDGRYLILTVWKGTDDKYMVMFKDLAEPYGTMNRLIDHFENEYSFIGNDGPVFYFKTDLDAPKGRVIAIDSRRPDPEFFREIIPQAEETLQGVGLTANMLVASYLKDAVSYVRMFDVNGKHIRDVKFPGLGSGGGFGGRRTDTETFYGFSSFNMPPSLYRYDMITGESQLWKQAKVDFNPDDYEVTQVFYNSRDGTRVPMFIAHRKGISLDGNNPTLLYGYGGFNIPMTPGFSISRLAWMEMGGVFAMACLRGGGEYGEEWHQAGTKLQKQNVFDDFIAAAEWLIKNNYTRPEKLAIQGGSNGGLLVGATMAQRPDLFGAALPAVGVMDMLRFHKFTAGRFWVDDYGSADDCDQFKALYAYSPYHQMLRIAAKGGASFPSTLITTADTDDRVVPGHSFKFAAALQKAQKGDRPVLIRIETKAGHGAGKPTSKMIEEIADMWAFLAHELEMDLQAPYR